MKVQVKKNIIPEEISEAGGASLVIVNKETVDLETSIDEAKDALCVVGDKLLIKGMFVGLFKSMVKGIERDGNARTLGDFLTLYPVPTGEFDLDKGWDPAVNGVRIRARLMNEMEIDISNWEFEDVTPGRQAFTLESVQAGAVTGVIALDKAVAINGRNLPATADVRVEYAVPETGLSGTVAPAKVVSTATRLDIAADALAALNVETNDGKKIVFTVRGNFANAKISGLLKYAPPVPIAQSSDGTVKVMTFTDDGQSATFTAGNPWLASGSGLVETSATGFYVDAATVCKDDTGGGETCQLTRDATGATLGITLPPLAIPSGTYPNATVRIILSKTTQSGAETLILPINLVVQ